MIRQQRKTPVAAGAGNKAGTASFYPLNAAAVKFKDPGVLICGQCTRFKDKPPASRRHCEILGDTVSRNDECRIDPLSPAYAWIDHLPVDGAL